MSNNQAKKFLKAACVFLVIVLLAGSFAGCSGSQNTDKEAGTAATAETAIAKTQTANELPIIDVEVCVRSQNYENVDAMKNDRIKKYIEDKFRINLKLTSNTYENTGQKALLAFTSGEVADYYLVPTWTEEGVNILEKSIEEDIFTNIGDIVSKDPERYSTLNKMFADPLYKLYNEVKFGDPERYVCTWAINSGKSPFAAPVFNMKYLDKLGLKLPETVDDFINIIRVIKKSDPDGNGKIDTIPFSPTTFKASVPAYELTDIFFSINGATAYNWIYVPDDNGVFQETSISEGFKASMKQVAALYKEGLIDKELFTKETYANVDDVASGKTASATFAAPNVDGAQYEYAWKPFKQKNPDAVVADLQFPAKPLIGTNALTGATGPMKFWTATLGVGDAGIIPTSCKNPERVLDLVNWIFSTEGQTVAHYGIESVHYTKGSDGAIKLNVEEFAKDTYKIYNPDNANMLLWGNFGLFINGAYKFTDIDQYGWADAARNAFLPMVTDGRVAVDEVRKYAQDIAKSWESLVVELPPYVNFVKFSEAEKQMKSKVDDLKNQYFMKFLVGELDVDKDWDEYVKVMEDAGATALVNSYNQKVLEIKERYEKYIQ